MNAPTPDDDFNPMEVEDFLEDMEAKHDWTIAEVSVLPNCQFPHAEPTLAYVDGATIQGPWGYMCETHFKAFGVGLGMGKGQRLIKAR